MNKKEFVSNIWSRMRDLDIRKKVLYPPYSIFITDSLGNEKEIVVKHEGRGVLLSISDIAQVIDTAIEVSKEAMRTGDDIIIQGFGRLFLEKYGARTLKHPTTGEPVRIEEGYTPKFKPAKELKMFAKVYQFAKKDEKFANLDVEAAVRGELYDDEDGDDD